MIDAAYLPHLFLLIAGGAIVAAGRIVPRAAFWGPAAFVCLLVSAWLFTAGFEKGQRVADSTQPRDVAVNSLEAPFQTTATGFTLLLGGLLSLSLWHVHRVTETPADAHGGLLIALAGTLLTVAADDVLLLLAGLETAGLAALWMRSVLSDPNQRSEILRRGLWRHGVSTVALVVGTLFLIATAQGVRTLSSLRIVLLGGIGDGWNPLQWHIGLVLLFAGISMRLSLVPFHFGRREISERSSTEADFVAFVLPTLAAFLFLYRVCYEATPGFESTAIAASLVLAGGTMIAGPLLAIAQTNLRTTLLYLVIGYGGTILFGLALAWGQAHPETVAPPGVSPLTRGVVAWGLALASGLLSFVGLYAMFVCLEDARYDGVPRPPEAEGSSDSTALEDRLTDGGLVFLEQLQGLFRQRPLVSVAIAVFLLNLVGVPPLPGFWMRLSALLSTFSIQRVAGTVPTPHWGFVIVAGLLLVQSLLFAVVAYRWCSAMFCEPALGHRPPGARLGALYAGLICLLLTILLALTPTRAFERIDSILGPNPKASPER